VWLLVWSAIVLPLAASHLAETGCRTKRSLSNRKTLRSQGMICTGFYGREIALSFDLTSSMRPHA
jgi:hypothetical protein